MSDESAEDRNAFGLAKGEVRSEPRASAPVLRWYAAVVGLFPFALIAFSIYWMTTGEYIHHSRSLYLSQIGYGMKLHQANCDVVIDGDSTAMVDIMPKVITARTGLSACDIAEVAGVKRINGMAAIDGYLANNRRPKYIVFQFAPEDLSDPAGWQWGGEFEGYLYGLQFGHGKDVLRAFEERPDASLVAVEMGFRAGVMSHLTRASPIPEAYNRDAQMGRMREPSETLTVCNPDDARQLAPGKAWLEGLRRTYGVDGTRVLIDVVPMTPCDPTLAYYREALKPGMVDNAVETMPTDMYIASGRLHMNDAGAALRSEQIADQILALQKGAR